MRERNGTEEREEREDETNTHTNTHRARETQRERERERERKNKNDCSKIRLGATKLTGKYTWFRKNDRSKA